MTVPDTAAEAQLRHQRLSVCDQQASLNRSMRLTANDAKLAAKLADLLARGEYQSGEATLARQEHAAAATSIQAQYNLDVAQCRIEFG